MFGSGLQEASSSLIGNMIGANKVGLAWHYAQILSVFTILFALASQVPLFFYLDDIVNVFTKEEKVKDLLVAVLPLIFICFFFDAVQAQRQGVIRGLSL